jgi:hypothetical protein
MLKTVEGVYQDGQIQLTELSQTETQIEQA